MFVYTPEYYPDPTGALAVDRVAAAVPRFMPRKDIGMVYICSPFAGDVERNKKQARRYCRFAVGCGQMPIAPHLFFPQFMNDADPEQRALAMRFCKMLLGKCRQLWVFGDRISAGMAEEIERARRRGMPIRYFNSECEEVYRND